MPPARDMNPPRPGPAEPVAAARGPRPRPHDVSHPRPDSAEPVAAARGPPQRPHDGTHPQPGPTEPVAAVRGAPPRPHDGTHLRPDPAERPDLPEGPRTVFSRFTMPADDWAREDAAQGPRTLDALMAVLLAALAAAAVAAVAWYRGSAGASPALAVVLAALVVAAAMAFVAMRRVRRDLHGPLSALYAWALGMCSGDFSTRAPAHGKGAYPRLAFHVNRLSEALERLANEMDDVVGSQTERLREKNASLELLYEVAASINRLDSIDEILRVSAESMMEMVGARGAAVCLRDAAGELSAAVRIGGCPEGFEPGPDVAGAGRGLSPPGPDEAGEGVSLPGSSGTGAGHDVPPSGPGGTVAGVSPPEAGDGAAGVVTVPLDHKGGNLGVICLFTESPEPAEPRERHRLLLSVGRHLGMSIAKARTDDESKMLSIVRERAAIAYELHDSLAQTLVSLRLQANMLADSLAGTGAGREPPELARIRATLEDANVELRELIAGFRAPAGGRDLRTALEEMAARFTAQSALAVHLQIDGELPEFSAGPQLQVVRIVGEALANACAHGHGRIARVLVRGGAQSVRVLVEDDGEGFSAPPCADASGDHIGLSVMRERARWLGGTLAVESEPGEGTRVTLAFPRALAAAPEPSHAH